MSENILFEATFKVGDINKLKYDRVSRFEAICEARPDLQVFLDVNTELYPVEKDEILSIALALTLNIDGMKEEAKGWRAINRGDTTLADEYDYVCYGKIYRFDEGEGQNIKVYISFGGLLMFIDGPYDTLAALRVDNIYLLIKR